MEEQGLVKYKARDGQELSISISAVKKYLVSGRAEAVTDQEVMYFLGVCKSRGLNPFKKDCYLIKYGVEPAAIITSIDYFRSRARAQKDCKGWKKGIIVKNKEGKLRDSLGLVLDDETLIGGFFEARPAGWDDPFRLEVNLRGYIKKTKDGKTTRFWHPDNQPTMIAKVAEGQGLRTLWPDEFQGLYQDSEIQEPPIDIKPINSPPVGVSKLQRFLNSKSLLEATTTSVEEFCEKSAKAMDIPVSELKAQASEDLDAFWSEYKNWERKNKPAPEPEVDGNWWNDDRHWKFLKKENFGKMVLLGLGFESEFKNEDYPEAQDMLGSTNLEVFSRVSEKYDRYFGNGSFKALRMAPAEEPEPEREEQVQEEEKDEDLQNVQGRILKDCLKEIEGFSTQIVTAARAESGFTVGQMPATVDEATLLIDACKKATFKREFANG